jgi:hypothetical protein
MELTEVTRRKDADEQRAHAECKDVACRPRMEITDLRDEKIGNHRVEESPDNIDRRRGEPLAVRFCKGTLKGRPTVPATKCGMTFAANAPPKIARARWAASPCDQSARCLHRRQSHGYRWSIRRSQGGHRRLLDHQVCSQEEAIEWAKRAPMSNQEIIEVRQIFETVDFPADAQKAAEGSKA